jgi:hypothetical protein
MGKSNVSLLDVLKKIFNNTTFPWDGIGNLYVSLHTADPTPAGNQQSSEATYTGYARVAVSRDGSGWTASSSPAVNVAEITFPQCTGGSDTITHVAIGTLSTGTGEILYSGALNSPINVSNNITPRIIPSALQISEA